MRIGLFTDTYYPEINGVATSVYQLKKELEANGNQVYVFTVSNPIQKEEEKHVYRIKSIPCILLKERRISCSFTRKWYKIIKELNLDVIHTQTEFNVGHIGRRAAEKFHIPLVHTYHTIYEDYTHYLKIPGNQKMKGIIRRLSRICLNKADLVVVPTEKVKRIIQGYGVKKPIITQPTGINLSKFERVDWDKVIRLRNQYGIKEKDNILLSIGRLSHEKNIEEIIKFLPKLVKRDINVKFFIVGGGPEKSVLENMVNELKLSEHVVFTGEIEWNEIQNYYVIGNVFVSASTSETQGLTYAEALASGKPLLVHKDECLNELLQSGINGYAYQNEEEFINYYHMLFLKKNIFKEKEIRESVQKLSSKSFGKNMEKIYVKVMRNYRHIEMERCEDIHKVMYKSFGKRPFF